MRLGAQLCGQTQVWQPDGGTSTCASRSSPPSVTTLAWLGAGPEIRTKHSSQSDRHAEYLNVKPGGK